MPFEYYNTTQTKCLTLPLLILLLFVSFQTAVSQHNQSKKTIINSYNSLKTNELSEFFTNDFKLKQMAIAAMLRSKSNNSSAQTHDYNNKLVDIGTDGTPIYYQTLTLPQNFRETLDAFEDISTGITLEGFGMEVGVWDEGVALSSHQEFDIRINKLDGSNHISDHTTLVTGALIAAGIKKNAKGVVPAATTLSHDWVNDKGEVVEQAANGMLVSNHSYGIDTRNVPDWYFGAYIQASQHWDRIMYNFPYYLMVAAAGNSQKSGDNQSPNSGINGAGFDLLLGFTTSKNNIVVAGANTTYSNGLLSKATVSNYSSFGPIDDSRIKPDLAAHGTEVFSTSAQSNTSYNTSTGTSMAAPKVTGSLLILQQHYFELFNSYMKAATLKGLALHTADDILAPGPDYKMGWGVLNQAKAIKLIDTKELNTLIAEETITTAETKTYTVIANGNEPLFASISWTDPEGSFINKGDLNSTKAALINDLDIRITKNGATYYPWRLHASNATAAATQGDNSVDPFERIDIENASGEYTITITYKGELENGSQDYSLIVSGAKFSRCSIETPTDLSISSISDHAISLSWNGSDEALHEVQFKSTNASEWQVLYTPENVITLNNLEMGANYLFKVRTLCTASATSPFTLENSIEFYGANTTLSYNQNEESPKLMVYPNPSVDAITVHSSMNSPKNYNIVTTSGNIIKNGNHEEKINVSDLKSGMYILTIEGEDGIASTKFFKD